MWKELEPPKVMKLTHALAKRFAEMTPAPQDRNISDRRCNYLRKTVANGAFRTCEWASVICKETGTEYRINGKHTSTMFAEMNGEMPNNIRVAVQRYECDTLEDVAILYCSFDTRSSVRSTGDINRVFAASHKDLADLPHRVVNVAVTGISIATWGDKYFQETADVRASLMLVNGDFIVWLDGIIHGGESAASGRHLMRGAVVGAMFKTFTKSQKAATEFWTAVRDASGTDNKSADRVLARYLDRTTVATGRGAKAGKNSASTREVLVKCIHAWNAWRGNDETGLKYYPDAPIPPVK